MSVHRVTEIRCNGADCDSALTWNGNAADVRRHAKYNCGWITAQPGGADYCSPACLATPRSATR